MNEIATPLSSSFADEVSRASGADIRPCYQCRKCSAGCPVAWAMDLLPHQVIRLIQYGCKIEVLSSRSIWICASCHTCSVRCPNEVDFAAVMDALRHLALREGTAAAEKEIPLFHQTFLHTIRRGGRVHELALIWRFKAKTGNFLKDVALGWKMFRRGKIKIIPPKAAAGGEIREIFAAYERRAKK